MRLLTRVFLAVSLLFICTGISAAEMVTGADLDMNVPTVIGLGIARIPDYMGSDDYKAAPIPLIKYTFAGSERYVRLAGLQFSANVLNSKTFYLGPVISFHGARDDEVEDRVVSDMDEVDSGADAGVFATYVIRDANPRNKVDFTIKALADTSGVSNGVTGDLDVTVWRQASEKFDVFFGGGLTFADQDYMDTYFSVNDDNRGDASEDDLPDYKADGSMRDLRFQIGSVWHYSQKWIFGGLARYQVLMDDAANSPIVNDRGSQQQLTVGLIAAYLWR